MTQLAHHTFAFEDAPIRAIVRDDEPWFVGKDVCTAMEIGNSRDALARLDADEKDCVGVTDAIGRQRETTIISEPGVYRLVFTSRTEKAEAFKRWLAHEVLPALRRNGVFAIDEDLLGGEGGMLDGYSRWQSSHVNERLKLIERTAGPQAALALWRHYKLPDLKRYAISSLVGTAEDDAPGCLRHLLRVEARSQITVGQLLDLALRDSASAPALRDHGMIIDPGAQKGFVAFADFHPFLRQAFASTQWAGEWKKALIHLDGATRTKKKLIFNGHSSEAVLVPRPTVLNLRHRGAMN